MKNSLRLLRFAVLLGAAILAFASCTGKGKASIPDTKKGIMDAFVAGTLDPSYAPAAFFIHYHSDQKEGDPAVQAHLNYFRESGMDILKVQFEQGAPRVRDITDIEKGTMEFIPEDFYKPTLEIIAALQKAEGENVYVIPTLYSPYQISHNTMGEERVMAAAKEHPDLYKILLDSYQKALLWLIKECKKVGIQGFYMCTQGGEIMFKDIPGFFENFVLPYDMTFMGECCRDTKMNILHICNWEGPYDDLTRYKDYPGQIINTPDDLNGTPFSLADGVKLFGRPMLGGFNRQGEFNTVSAEEAAALTHKILDGAPKGRVMIGADCTVGSAPLENIKAAIAAAHGQL